MIIWCLNRCSLTPCGLLGLTVVTKQAHLSVEVRAEIHLIDDPHLKDFLYVVVGDVLDFLQFEVVNPNIVGHTTAIVFWSEELKHLAVVGNLFTFYWLLNPASIRHGQLLGQAAVDFDDEDFAYEVESTLFVLEKDDVLVVLPCRHYIILFHTMAYLIATQGLLITEACRYAALRFMASHFLQCCSHIWSWRPNVCSGWKTPEIS